MLMKPMPHKVLLTLALIGAAGLCSCKTVKKNVEIATDRVTPARADDVMVESQNRHFATAAAPVQPAGSAPAAATSISAGSSARPGGGVVIVKPGDTLSGIARRNKVTVSALCAVNGITDKSRIRPGQQLRLPGRAALASAPVRQQAGGARAAAPRGARSYTVRRGDTISGIAAKTGVPRAALLKANNMTPQQANRIREGQVLRLPAHR